MKRWHLYKEYVKTKAGEEGLIYQALFCTDENGIYERHIDIVYDVDFAHDIIKYIDNNSYFTFQYKRSQIEYVTSERNILKKIEMIKDIPEEATKVKTIYKLHQDIASEDGVLEHYSGNFLILFILANDINLFESYNEFSPHGKIPFVRYLMPNGNISVSLMSDNQELGWFYQSELSMFNSYDIFINTHKQFGIYNDKRLIINYLLVTIFSIIKFRKMTYSYMSETKSFTVEKDLQKLIDNLELFTMDNFEENNVDIDVDANTKKIIKFTIEVGKAKQKGTKNIKAENNLHRIFKQNAERMREEDLLYAYR